ncbi:MAG: hypothetical protein WBM90_04390 [Acidimicrobiia bacterium]
MNDPTPALDLLAADGPHQNNADRLMQFGRFVGSWVLEASFFGVDGTEEETTAEWHWIWILGGRAIQDVLVFPAKSSAPPADGYRYGTTLRVLDESDNVWRVVWVAPQTGTVFKLSGAFSDDGGVVLVGDPHDGEPTKWVFSGVTPETFLWEGYVKDDQDSDWRLIQRMTAQRTA